MFSILKSKKIKGPMDDYFKPSYKLGTSSGCNKPFAQRQLTSAPTLWQTSVKQEVELHASHSFQWYGSAKVLTDLTCNKAGTIEDSLKRSAQFRELAGRNKNKELVILRDGKAISSHFPCSLIKDERLDVTYIKASEKPKQSAENCAPRKVTSDALVTFHVLTKGGKHVVRFMRNRELGKKCEEITVYAYKGEKVKHALKRDGRLQDVVFKKNCALFTKGAEVRTEMLDLVDNLDGKTVKIKMINKSAPPESPPQSLDDAYVPQNESQTSDCDENENHQQQLNKLGSVKASPTKEREKSKGNIQAETIPNSEGMRRKLNSEVKNLVKKVKTGVPKVSDIQKLYHEEYGKNAETCREVKTMKRLMNLSDSVCQVRVNGRPKGSGFLLFDKFVLTNGHVLDSIYDESTRQFSEQMTVHFSFESLDQSGCGAKVEEVTGFEHCFDASGHMYDWALLKLSADRELPRCLLNHFGFLPRSGGICIIGHPDGGVKKIDSCLIIPTNNRTEVVARHCGENPEGVLVEDVDYSENQEHIQLVTHHFFENVAKYFPRMGPALTYESCFYFGSSGSPVFDEHCNVVAMHSGGYAYRKFSGERNSVIEYGYPLSFILEHIILQMVERERFDVLREFLACNYVQHQNMMTNLKKLVESRNLTSFKKAFDHAVHTNDKSLMMFFGLLSQKEEPFPMDID
ncbi:serine protease FAM111A-like [Cheilinus undulatus]|uniref:serine protease FAM111A-like n=1 Tax=Cheilinus undulatus TaxID=241271 RepID=UPI001BD2DEDE|nr:serine protease FAM111A-like [Cheilinus undulatus]XP_041656689.1 serine protease FAM111A-like [Cheilinus undulatus]